MAPHGRSAAPDGGDLAGILQALTPETMRQIGQALRGVDLGSLMAAPPVSTPAVGGAMQGRVDLIGALTGLSEVLSYFGANPIRGRKWTLKDVADVLGLLRSPNIQALVGTARAAPHLVRAGRQLAPLLSALRRAKGGTEAHSRRGRKGARRGSAPPQGAASLRSAEGQGSSIAATSPVIRFRFSQPVGSPTVLEPWTGSD